MGYNEYSVKAKTSFASVLSDEDLTESLAKSNVVNEKMIDVLGSILSDEKALGKPGAVKIGNNIIQFSNKRGMLESVCVELLLWDVVMDNIWSY